MVSIPGQSFPSWLDMLVFEKKIYLFSYDAQNSHVEMCLRVFAFEAEQNPAL